MAYQQITVLAAPGSYDSDGLVGVETTWDSTTYTDGLEFPSTGNELVIARNTGAGTRVCTVVSVADELGRTGDLAKTIAAGGTNYFGPMRKKGFAQTSGRIRIVPAHAEVKITVLRLS